jgi:hypothetical protein
MSFTERQAMWTLGIPPVVARDHNLVSRLKNLKYSQVAK